MPTSITGPVCSVNAPQIGEAYLGPAKGLVRETVSMTPDDASHQWEQLVGRHRFLKIADDLRPESRPQFPIKWGARSASAIYLSDEKRGLVNAELQLGEGLVPVGAEDYVLICGMEVSKAPLQRPSRIYGLGAAEAKECVHRFDT